MLKYVLFGITSGATYKTGRREMKIKKKVQR